LNIEFDAASLRQTLSKWDKIRQTCGEIYAKYQSINQSIYLANFATTKMNVNKTM